MLEQKHNKRAAISQASSNSNPNRPSSVTSAPSNTLLVDKTKNIRGAAEKKAAANPSM